MATRIWSLPKGACAKLGIFCIKYSNRLDFHRFHSSSKFTNQVMAMVRLASKCSKTKQNLFYNSYRYLPIPAHFVV